MAIRPMLAEKADLSKLVFPLFGSPKLDGIRCVITETGQALSRSGKPIRNTHVQTVLSRESRYRGLDGELIVGAPNAPDVYRVTNSGVMSAKGEPDFKLWVFDRHDRDTRYIDVYKEFTEEFCSPSGKVDILQQTLLANLDEVLAYEEGTLAAGFEGVILRRPNAPYKYGRSTVDEGYLLKLKRMEASEAVVTGVEEEMHNANVATTDALGYTERSTSKEGLIPKDRLGKLLVQDIHHPEWVFKIGTGFTAADREALWRDPKIIGKIVTYNYFAVGMKDLPRHPSFKGFRSMEDL